MVVRVRVRVMVMVRVRIFLISLFGRIFFCFGFCVIGFLVVFPFEDC